MEYKYLFVVRVRLLLAFYTSRSPPAADCALARGATFNSLLSGAVIGHLGKGWIVRGISTMIALLG